MIAPILAFIVSPIGKIVMIALGIVAAVAFVDRRATYRERARCDVAAARAERDAALQDLNASRAALAKEKTATVVLEKQKETDDAARRSLEAEVAKRTPADRCGLSDADARRLR